jgi:hypothetical protein
MVSFSPGLNLSSYIASWVRGNKAVHIISIYSLIMYVTEYNDWSAGPNVFGDREWIQSRQLRLTQEPSKYSDTPLQKKGKEN